MAEKTIEKETCAGRLHRATDSVGRAFGEASKFFSDRVLPPISEGASRLSPVAEAAKDTVLKVFKGGKDTAVKVGGTAKNLVTKAGGTARDAIGDGLAAGHRMVRKVPGIASAEDRVSAAVKGLPDRLDLVRADDITALKRSVDSLDRQVDRLVEKATA